MTDQRNTPPTPLPEDLSVLAGEYVLGTMPAAERQGVQQRLPGDKALQQAVAEWEARLLPLTQLWLHGHLHAPSDYTVSGTNPATQEAWQCRVVANPLGYARKGEQATFQSQLCLTV